MPLRVPQSQRRNVTYNAPPPPPSQLRNPPKMLTSKQRMITQSLDPKKASARLLLDQTTREIFLDHSSLPRMIWMGNLPKDEDWPILGYLETWRANLNASNDRPPCLPYDDEQQLLALARLNGVTPSTIQARIILFFLTWLRSTLSLDFSFTSVGPFAWTLPLVL